MESVPFETGIKAMISCFSNIGDGASGSKTSGQANESSTLRDHTYTT
jgi:hypothetical protein